MRIKFEEIFEITSSKHLIIKKAPLRVDGITVNCLMTLPGTLLGMIDWNLFDKRDLEIKEAKDGTIVIVGIF